jgi:hypothetical protein
VVEHFLSAPKNRRVKIFERRVHVGFKELFEEAASGDKVAVAIRDRMFEHLGGHRRRIGSCVRSGDDCDRRQCNEERRRYYS